MGVDPVAVRTQGQYVDRLAGGVALDERRSTSVPRIGEPSFGPVPVAPLLLDDPVGLVEFDRQQLGAGSDVRLSGKPSPFGVECPLEAGPLLVAGLGELGAESVFDASQLLVSQDSDLRREPCTQLFEFGASGVFELAHQLHGRAEHRRELLAVLKLASRHRVVGSRFADVDRKEVLPRFAFTDERPERGATGPVLGRCEAASHELDCVTRLARALPRVGWSWHRDVEVAAFAKKPEQLLEHGRTHGAEFCIWVMLETVSIERQMQRGSAAKFLFELGGHLHRQKRASLLPSVVSDGAVQR